MELAENGELFRFLQLSPRFSEKIARNLFIQIIDSNISYIVLDYLNQQSITHLDIKPENLLLGKEYELLLADFGFA